MSWVFTNGQGDRSSIPKTQKMVLGATLINPGHYKVTIKDVVEQSGKWNSASPLHRGVVAIEKGTFRSSSTKVANFTYILTIYTNMDIYTYIINWALWRRN